MNPNNTLLPTPQELKEIFDYCPETGIIRNKVNRARTPKARAGMISGAVHKKLGYIFIGWKNSHLLGHRVAWAIHYGEWPADQIDHRNNIRTDNRIVNLRAASKAENNRNMKISCRNKSGFKGVYWSKSNARWIAKICFERKETTLGRFKIKEEAAAAYAEAAHRLHGEFAHTGQD